ncbi:MAG: DNA translocase FtsK [Clostridiales bacterium]|nr:DNA translocase FtsK [Clostridiales bacterium]
MAVSQTKKSQTKKTTAKKPASTRKSTAKKTASAAKKSKTTASKASSAKTPAPAGRRRNAAQASTARTVWAAILLLLAVFSALSWFQVQGSFIAFLEWLERGLVGCGYWFAPVGLLIASGVLFFHRNRPVLGRTVCALLLPLLVGAMVHTVLGTLDLNLATDGVSCLWDLQGQGYTGGVLGGSAAVALSQVFSRWGALFLLLLVTAAVVMVLTCVTPELLADKIIGAFSARQEKRRKAKAARQAVEEEPRPGLLERLKPGAAYDLEEDEEEEEPEEPEEPEAPEEKKTAHSPVSRRRFRKEYDLPVDEMEAAPHEVQPPVVETIIPEGQDFIPVSQMPKKQSKNEKLFNGKPAVSTPGDYLAKVQQEEQEEQPAKKSRKKRTAPVQMPTKELSATTTEQKEDGYHAPPIELLKEAEGVNGSAAGKELEQTKALLEETIQSFGIESNIVEVTRGPSVTRYDLELERGIRLNKLTNLSKDIALSLGVVSVRIAPVPGQNSVVGIEVPNKLVNQVTIRSVIDSKEFREAKSPVAFAVGKDIANNNVVGDIAKLPHMLIAGTTGSGKSVCTNSLIVSLLYKSSPEDVNLIMIDPKMVELGNYNGIPHLRIPVVTDPKKAAGALQWAVYEMMQRYQLFAGQGVRELNTYNAVATANPDLGAKKLPRVVIVIDELADLMLVAAKEVEESICRVAQMGRAAGMHLIIATQRPSTDVITGLMKANIPSRIALAVASSLESRIILDSSGAENLVGNGDMLFAPLGKGKRRVQGCFISEEEVNAVIEDIKANSAPSYDEEVIQQVEEFAKQNDKKGKGGASAMNVTMPEGTDQQPEQDEGRDPLFVDAVDTVVETEMASVSMLQRKLKLGYARAARLVDQMEEAGVVGPFEGSKPRKVLVSKERWSEMKLQMGQQTGLDANLELAKAMSAAADAEAFSGHEDI